jgi:hypothetical protein
MHGGRVMVESSVGGGSTFTVTLPADPRTSADAVATGAVEPPAAAPAPAGAAPATTVAASGDGTAPD